ncbi:hypothetical protein JT90_15730, partial [Listeria monocytogenes]|nr:hypothetical protein [Listeria monocytogenes]EAC2319321.1 hypothetical protein [Listeria monocytogenes]EAC2587812.1 hypothetical protein [Listeria monocytogenes]EAC2591021.1 hypothetical protein [Listeria monocytogenes]EAC2645169.1 hypothetical protein [Listeria monocytogenes]
QVNNFITTENNSITGKNVDIPLILHESTLTNLVWLKSPNKFSDLPKRKLLSHVLAAKLPNENLWDHYIKFIDDQAEHEKFTDEDIINLKYNPIAKELLMEKTYGNPDYISFGLTQEILKGVKERNQEELRQANEKQKEDQQMIMNQKDEEMKRLQIDLDTSKKNNKEIKDDDYKLRSKIYNKKLSIIAKSSKVIVYLLTIMSACWSVFTLIYDIKGKMLYIILTAVVGVMPRIIGLMKPCTRKIMEKCKNKIWEGILSNSNYKDFERPDK